MLNKKIVLPFLFFYLINFCFCNENILDGNWIYQKLYDLMIEKKEPVPWIKRACIFIDQQHHEFYDGRSWLLKDIYTDDRSQLIFVIGIENNEWERKIICTFIDSDTVFFEGDLKGTGIPYGRENLLYRISGPAKIPIQNAVLNDSHVRLRVKPNLSCDTWGFLNKGDAVKIKDKSEEPFIIDGESWYWYKVESKNYPDGWVYGKYLDIEEGNEGKVNKDISF